MSEIRTSKEELQVVERFLFLFKIIIRLRFGEKNYLECIEETERLVKYMEKKDA